MGIFSKLFGKRSPSPAEAELVTRAPRVLATPLHQLSFESENSQAEYYVRNISLTGIALVQKGDSPLTEVGTQIVGTLDINGQKIGLELEARHHIERLIGAHIISVPRAYERALLEYFEYELLGLELVRVRSEFLKPNERGEVTWYTDSRGNEIYVVSHQEQIVEYHFFVLGHYFEDIGQGLKYGFVENEENKIRVKPAQIIEMSEAEHKHLLPMILTVLDNTPGFPAVLRNQLHDRIS